MLTITLQPQTPEQFAAALELLQRIRADQETALARQAPIEVAEEVAPVDEAPKPVRRARKSAPAEVSQPVQETNTSPEPVQETAKNEHVPRAEAPAPRSEQTYTLEHVRARLAGLSTDGKRDEVKALLSKYGATRLTEIKPDDYAAVMADAEGL